MIAAVPLPPAPGDVVLAILAVLAGCLVAATAAHLAWRSRNWLYHVGTVGGLVIVAGIVGQRTPVPGASVGPWDAGITVPVLGTRLTPVCAAGLVLSLICVTLVLLFERVPDAGSSERVPQHRGLEEDDAV